MTIFNNRLDTRLWKPALQLFVTFTSAQIMATGTHTQGLYRQINAGKLGSKARRACLMSCFSGGRPIV